MGAALAGFWSAKGLFVVTGDRMPGDTTRWMEALWVFAKRVPVIARESP